jgi:hypothetical protein
MSGPSTVTVPTTGTVASTSGGFFVSPGGEFFDSSFEPDSGPELEPDPDPPVGSPFRGVDVLPGPLSGCRGSEASSPRSKATCVAPMSATFLGPTGLPWRNGSPVPAWSKANHAATPTATMAMTSRAWTRRAVSPRGVDSSSGLSWGAGWGRKLTRVCRGVWPGSPRSSSSEGRPTQRNRLEASFCGGGDSMTQLSAVTPGRGIGET